MSGPVTFGQGYTSTLIGQVVSMHAAYYAERVGFGLEFEAKVAREMAEFMQRIDHPSNALWWAALEGRIAASIAIDGEPSPHKPAILHWFIVEPALHGQGVGRRLMDDAMAFCDAASFPSVELSTFAGLDAARSLYERAGFVLTSEQAGNSWGQEVIEQTFVRKLPASR